MVAALALVAVVAVCKAGQDALWHNWSRSAFARAGADRLGYWGDAALADRRRFVGREYAGGRLPLLDTPVVGTLLLTVWDGWHLLALVRAVSLSAIPTASGLPWWTWPAAFAVHTVAFEATYRAAR